MEETRTVREVVQDEILSARTQRYRRNLVALCLVAIAIHFFDFVDFKKLSLFGLEIQEGRGEPKELALYVLWLLVAYNASFGGYGAYWDWRQWVANLTAYRKDHTFFPELRMFFGEGHGPENKFGHRSPPEPNNNKTIVWEFNTTRETGTWTCRETDEGGRINSFYHPISLALINDVKEKWFFFHFIEIGIPSILLSAAIILADRDIF